MRTKLTLCLHQLIVVIGLSAIAFGQTDGRQTDEPGENQSIDHRSSSSLLKKVEDWIGLTDNRLDELAAIVERVQVEIAKKKMRLAQANNDLKKAAQVLDEPLSSPVPPATPITPNAEIGVSESFDPVAGDNVGETADMPVLNGSTPEWVKNGLVLGDEHSLAISSTLLPDLDQCREDLKSRMMSDVRAYLDKHVLEIAHADELPKLTQDYVEKYWVKKGQLFDNIQDRPSGTYHQLWIGLHISSEQLAKIREWEKQSVREERAKKVGVLGGLSVVSIALLSGAVGLLARREKATLKK